MLAINGAAVGIAVVLAITAFLAPRPAGRDPVFATLVRAYWGVYLVLAAVIALRPPTAIDSHSELIGLHAVNLVIALAVELVTRRAARHVDDASTQRTVEKLGMQQLQSAALQLKLSAGALPVSAERGALDSTLGAMLDAIRFAPSRVPPELEHHVADALAMVESTGEKMRTAVGQPAEWYLIELHACESYVSRQLAHVQTHMSAKRS